MYTAHHCLLDNHSYRHNPHCIESQSSLVWAGLAVILRMPQDLCDVGRCTQTEQKEGCESQGGSQSSEGNGKGHTKPRKKPVEPAVVCT